MELTEIAKIALGSIGILVVIFKAARITNKIESFDEKFASIDRRFELLDHKLDAMDKKFEARFDKVDEKLASLDKGQNELRIQVGKLETRVEERTLRVVHTTREIKPDPFHFGALPYQEESVAKNAT